MTDPLIVDCAFGAPLLGLGLGEIPSSASGEMDPLCPLSISKVSYTLSEVTSICDGSGAGTDCSSLTASEALSQSHKPEGTETYDTGTDNYSHKSGYGPLAAITEASGDKTPTCESASTPGRAKTCRSRRPGQSQ